jgi:hypothetical protein
MGENTIDKKVIRCLADDAGVWVKRSRLVPPVTLDELREMAETLIKTEPRYHQLLNWAILFLNNALWNNVVAAIPPNRKLLLIPQCLKSIETCPAKIDELGLLCEACGACVIAEIQKNADEIGMMCMVAEGSTMVARLIEEGDVDAVIGVSCFNALEKAFTQMINHAVPGAALPLYGEGCKNTRTDTEYLLEIIRRRVEPPMALPPLKPLLEQVKTWFDEERLSEIMGKPRHRPEQIARDCLSGDGKRYRPFLCVAVAESLGAAPVDSPALMKLAVAVECFHKASLVHDDIEDGDEWRNGAPTLQARHGMPTALNTGDLLLGEGYRMISELPLPAAKKATMLQIAATGHLDLCRGQGEELLHKFGQEAFRCDELLDVFRRKTAPAFNVAFQFGAAFMNAGKRERAVLDSFSEHLGIAYQIMDDLSDVDSQTSGGIGVIGGPSIIATLEREFELSHEAAVSRARALLEVHRNQALRSLSPLRTFRLKRLLFQVTHAILKEPA